MNAKPPAPWLVLSAFVLVLLLFPGKLALAADPWGTDLEEAQRDAASSGKDVLVCFTVRELSSVCRMFHEHFMSRQDFTGPLQESFELVWFDSGDEPEGEDSPAFQRRERFEVATFPTLILITPDGLPYAYTGFRPNGVEAYLEHLSTLRLAQTKRRELRSRAERASGLEKAQLLAASIPGLDAQRSARFYSDVMEEVLNLDPREELPETPKFKRALAEWAYAQTFREMDRELRWTEMVELTDRYIEEQQLSAVELQAALMNRFEVHRMQGNGLAMMRTLAEIVQVNPYNRHGREAGRILAAMTSKGDR